MIHYASLTGRSTVAARLGRTQAVRSCVQMPDGITTSGQAASHGPLVLTTRESICSVVKALLVVKAQGSSQPDLNVVLSHPNSMMG